MKGYHIGSLQICLEQKKVVDLNNSDSLSVPRTLKRPTSGLTHEITDIVGTRTFAYDEAMQPSSETIGSLVLDRSYDDYGRKSGLSVTMGGSVLNVDYEYDSATGRLSSAKIDDTHAFHYSHRWGLDLSGTLEGAGGVGGLLAIGKKTGTAIDVTCFYDGNGNVTQLLDLADGSVEARYEYDPFGKEIVATGDLADWNKYRFSTKYLEDEVLDASEGAKLDLYYYGYRYYSPKLGRWITRDPIEERGCLSVFASPWKWRNH